MKKEYQVLKRMLSLIMVFAMVLAMAPVTVHAADHTGGRVYFETDWNTACVQLMIGHSSWSQGYQMTKETGNLYYVDVPQWSGAWDFAVFGTPGVWGGEGNSIAHRKAYANESTGVDTSGYQFNAGSKYLITSTGSNNISVKVVYDVTVADTTNGTVTADKVLAGDEETVTLTVAPNDGYELEKLTVMNGTDEVTVTDNKFTMPAGNVTVNAAFQKIQYSVTFNGTNVTSNGAATATKGTDYTATLTAAEGYTLPETIEVKVGGTAVHTHTFENGVLTIPATSVIGDIVITAVGVEQVKDTILYLTPNANWKVDGARFAAYFFNNTTDTNTWASMTDSDSDGVYEVTVPEGTWPNVIFCRMNPNAAANEWSNKWNQTSDLTMPSDGTNHYTVAEGTWNNGSGTWSVFPPVAETYTVTFNGTNVTSNGAASVTEGEDYTATLTAAEGYTLPETVTVTGGTADYNKETGALTITGITGNVTITAAGVEIPAEPETVTIYFQNNWKWTDVRAYSWTGEGQDKTVHTEEFPGDAMTYFATETDGNEIYKFEIPVGANVIFSGIKNDGSGTRDQSPDITNPEAAPQCYYMTWDNTSNTNKVGTYTYTPTSGGDTKDFYLVGYINGADVGIEGDSANLGPNKFVDGKVTVTFSTTSYVVVKDSTGTQYWAPTYCETASTVLANGNSEKMKVDAGTYTFTLTENSDDTLTLSYVQEQAPVKTYTVAGTPGLCGTDWDPADTKNDMTKNSDGFYEKVYTDVAAGSYEFKVVQDHAWTNSWGKDGGNDNILLEVTKGGSTVTITFNEETKEITVTVEEGDGPEPEKTTYTAIFHFANTIGWSPVNLYVWNDDGATTGSWPGAAMTKTDDNGYKTMTVSYEAATNKGLNYIFNNGSQQTVNLALAATEFDADTNTAEVWVELDPTANADGKYVLKQKKTEPLEDILLAVSPRINGTSVTFEYASKTATSVELRGTVSGTSWDSGIALTDPDGDGLWNLTVDNLEPAVYKYKFVVDGNWYADPANGNTDAEGNSVFTILDPTAQDTNKIKINVFYQRADGIYVQANADGTATGTWNAYVWGDSIAGERYDFAKDTADLDGNGDVTQMVTTITVVGRDTQNVYLKTRMSTDTKEWLREEAQVSIPLENIVSGTINVFVVSDGQNGKAGNVTSSIVTGTDIVTANKVTNVSYDYEENKVIVTMLEALDEDEKLDVVDTTAMDASVVGDVTVSGNTYKLSLTETPSLSELGNYKVKYSGYYYDIAVDDVYATDKFATEYTYTGTDLGAVYTEEKTTFKVWAPTASAVKVKLYATGSDAEEGAAGLGTYPMSGGTVETNGVWTVTIEGNLKNCYYTYEVTVNGETVEACDPYARATGVNGNRAMVIDLDSTDPAGWSSDSNPNPVTSQTDAVIYELHVRDFSIDASSGVSEANRGKYLAFTEEGITVNNAGTTKSGVDYLEELGITHLHLLPVYDYGSVDETKLDVAQFNWGYDPVNYNVPEGSYSTNPYDGNVRVNEFKQMVMALHKNGISVVMDVVYNHVYNADKFCFNNIVPGYFSRTNSNASGCGNDTASEREMVRKYIVESVLYWAEEYHIDGFRFDLVGLLDTETINKIVTEVHAKYPNVIFYGEGWDMDSTNKEPGTEMAKQGNASKTSGFAYFSDSMRNGIGGSNGSSTGFASGAGNGSSMVSEWMANPWWTSNPEQVVQYASCHDNYTLADKLILSTNANGVTNNIIKMNNLAAAFYMTAQGVPFIHAGEEVLREKINENGSRVENSYNASDYVNHLDWTDMETYADNVAYYKGLIAFRAANPALRYATAAEISENVRSTAAEANLLTFRVDANGTSSTEDEDLLIIFNASKTSKTVTLPAGNWTIYINGEKAGTTSLGTAEGTVSVAGISAMVLGKPDEGKDEQEPLGPSEAKTIYFTNNQNWETVYAYAWTDGGQKLLLGQWPGTEATFYKTNEYNQSVYQITLPASETGVEGVIFTNNKGGNENQTVDIVPGVDGTGYYPSEKNEEGKWKVNSWTERAPVLGAASEYFLVGYINGTDYVGGDYPFDENGQVKTTFGSDSYVYVINGDSSETYMTDGYLGAVTSGVLKDTGKYTLTADKWDKLLIPGGAEVTITMVKNNDNTVTLSYEMDLSGVEDTSGIQDGVTLHCWNWSFEEIEANMATIAQMGYTAIQTSPVQPLKEATNLSTNSVGDHWWVYYQPVDFVITTDEGNALGTKSDLESMIETAHAYGVQVIVDVVANHLANQTGNDLSEKIPEYLLKDAYWHEIDTNISNWNDRYDMTQYCLDGLPDLNTANDEIQGYVLDFLTDCIDIGVDGFRFDMAKSIETPSDDSDFASDFWPTVIGGAEEYAKGKGKDVYMYGEVLDNSVIAISAYTKYMAVTDNSWGNNVRANVAAGNANLSAGYHKSAAASNLVIWAESHDTYANNSSSGVSEVDINKTWALVAARADAMGLYLARPESLDQAIGIASSTGWDNPEVGEVNKFHNAFAGQSEYLANEGTISYVERGTTGVVLVNAKNEAADVSVTANKMADGTYTDQISGNTFTVKDGKISGKIGDTGIAVVYMPADYEAKVEDAVSGSATVSNANPEAGEIVTITPVPDEGCKVESVTVKDQNNDTISVIVNNDGTFAYVQPSGDVTIQVVFKADYRVVEGDGSTADLDKSETLRFKVNAAFEKFLGIQINGKDVEASNYTVSKGSTIVVLKAEYLKTLSSSENRITFRFKDGNTEGTFKLTKATTETTAPSDPTTETTAPGGSTTETTAPGDSTTETTAPATSATETTSSETKPTEGTTPPTGDNSNIFLWSMLALFSAAAAAALVTMRKRIGMEE